MLVVKCVIHLENYIPTVVSTESPHTTFVEFSKAQVVLDSDLQ